MTLGQQRFEYFLTQLDTLLLEASKTENPALYLYKNDARTKVFMLQGLAKIYAGMHNEKKFLKIKERFKILEDMIGAIDYYDAFAVAFKKNKNIPANISSFLEKKTQESLSILNNQLLEKKWINHDPLRSKKIQKKLAKIDWQTPEKEVELISIFYAKSIKGITEFYESCGTSFTELETQVHEIRRKLRWLSIYVHAFRGAIQFSRKNVTDPNLKKYLTKDIVESPFNKMPAKGKNVAVMLLSKNYFLALSKTIATLGKLKDEGLKIHVLKDAILATSKTTDEAAQIKAYKLANVDKNGLVTILKKANNICKPFFEEKNLDKLLSNI
jgi:hypothetical protein